MRIVAVVLFALLTLAAPANAADVPDSAVQLRILSRAAMIISIEVTNPSDNVARFDSIGLYFIPDASAEEPQRLGVVSAGRVATADGRWVAATDIIDVAPHASIRVELTTYCLDVKREAPPSTMGYHLASRRMPTALSTALAGAARTVASLGYDPEGARPDAHLDRAGSVSAETQKAVWRVRAAIPVPLLGDRRRDAE